MRAAAGAGLAKRPGHRFANRDHVVAVDLLALDAGSDGLLRQGFGRRLMGQRHRDRPAVVVDHEDDRQLPDAGGIQCLGHIALRRCAVAEHTHGHPLLLPQLEGKRDTNGVRGMCPDRNADREILARFGKIAAPLVAAPEQQQLDRADPAPQLGTVLTEARQ